MKMAILELIRVGPVCTVQDGGRFGLMRFGVTPAGPMDWLAHRAANLSVGNAPHEAAIEIGPGGLHLAPRGAAVRLGIAASGFVVKRAGEEVPRHVALTLFPGEVLTIEPGASHVWAYLAVAGGLAVADVMGSRSTHLRTALGPFGGSALAAGMDVPVPALGRAIDLPDAVFDEPASGAPVVRFVPGPQDNLFAPPAHAALRAGLYTVSSRSDRMGYRLDGPPLPHLHGHDIVSDGIALGAIQVPGDRQPIVLMADRQPTGGYPKIGTVIRADLPRLAQRRAGQAVRFEAVTVGQAVAALRSALHDTDDRLAAVGIGRRA